MNRKEFIKTSCMLCGAALLADALLESCKKNNTTPSVNFNIDLSNSANAALNTVGGSVTQSNVVVIRTNASLAATSFTALASICTHSGCTVAYFSKSNNLVCPCHG